MHSLIGLRLAMTFHFPWLKVSQGMGAGSLTLLFMALWAIPWNKSLKLFARF
jgi:hypothetical protein